MNDENNNQYTFFCIIFEICFINNHFQHFTTLEIHIDLDDDLMTKEN